MPVLRRRPVLRAAAVGGGAYYAGRQRAEAQEREMQQEERISGLESHAAPASAGVSGEAIDRLQQLGQLHEQGVLTDEEFAQQKARLLGG